MSEVVILPVVRIERAQKRAKPGLREQADAVRKAIEIYRQFKTPLRLRYGLTAAEAERHDAALVAAYATLSMRE